MLIDDSLKVGDMVAFNTKNESTYHIVYSVVPSQYVNGDKSVNMKIIGADRCSRQALLRSEMINNKRWTRE